MAKLEIYDSEQDIELEVTRKGLKKTANRANNAAELGFGLGILPAGIALADILSEKMSLARSTGSQAAAWTKARWMTANLSVGLAFLATGLCGLLKAAHTRRKLVQLADTERDVVISDDFSDRTAASLQTHPGQTLHFARRTSIADFTTRLLQESKSRTGHSLQ